MLAVRIGTQPLSARARAGQPGGVACRVCPPGCMLGDDARGSVCLTPNAAGRPSVMLYAYLFLYCAKKNTEQICNVIYVMFSILLKYLLLIFSLSRLLLFHAQFLT